jgi:hypothetical protein
LPPSADAVRIRADAVTATAPKPDTLVERRKSLMSRSANPDVARDNGEPRRRPPFPSEAVSEPVPDPLEEAEGLRSLLHDAQLRVGRLLAALEQQRRHSRVLRAAVDSLRNLRLDH